MRNTGEGAKPPLRYSLNLSAPFRVWVTVWVRQLTHILTHTFFSIFATKSIENRSFRCFLELLGRFELPTSSLPTTVEPSSPCCIRLCGVFLSKKDEVAACLFHCFRPLISPCGSRCGSKLLHLIKKRRQNIKYDRTDDCPVRILIIMHKLKSSPVRFSFQKCSPSFK